MADDLTHLPTGYAELLGKLKDRIRAAQICAAQTVTAELVSLYWGIGREILARQRAEGWGTKVIDRLAQDLPRDAWIFASQPPQHAGRGQGIPGQ